MFSGDQKALWLVGSDVRDYCETPQDYAPIDDIAVDECPSNPDDLTLFQTKDVFGTTTAYMSTLRTAGGKLYGFEPGPDDHVTALAALPCKSTRDGDGDSALFFATMLEVDESVGQRLSDRAPTAFCPQLV